MGNSRDILELLKKVLDITVDRDSPLSDADIPLLRKYLESIEAALQQQGL